MSLLRVGTLRVAGRRELCLVRNVSAGGMMLRVYSLINQGERLVIELKQGEPIEGVACWTEEGCVGVQFDAPVDVIKLISTSLEGPRPRMPRIAVERMARLRADGEAPVSARVSDISQGGARVAAATPLPAGTHVVVTIDGLPPQPSVVRWTENGICGLTFNRIIALPELMHWLQDEEPARRARATG